MNDIADNITTEERGDPALAPRGLRRVAQLWNELLDAGVDRPQQLPPLRDYPYPTT